MRMIRVKILLRYFIGKYIFFCHLGVMAYGKNLSSAGGRGAILV